MDSKSIKQTTIITTTNHNIGDDFVREGILEILSKIINTEKIDLIHKHSPVSSVYGLESVRQLRVSKVIEPFFRICGLKNKVTDADLLIQSGAPVYWCHSDGPHCADNEWFDPLVRKRFATDRRNRKFLNIAGGSCQSYHSDGSELISCSKCRDYIAEFYDVCDLTILRDSLAQKMLASTGRHADILPCTSIFARDRFNITPHDGGYIVVNFMDYGGHYTFGQSIDKDKWRLNFQTIVKKLKEHGRVIAACHNAAEEKLAKNLAPEIERYIVPNNYTEFMKFYAGARFGIVNRVHAGFMMASLGKPATVIGNDSRALMIENLNLKSYYVNDINNDQIQNIINNLLQIERTYVREIEEIRKVSRANYEEKILSVL